MRWKVVLLALGALSGGPRPATAPCNDALPRCDPAGHCGQNCLGTTKDQTCKAECGDGYSPKGDGQPIYTCGPNGNGWVVNGSHLVCERAVGPIACGALPADRAKNTDDHCTGTKALNTCTAECEAGYTAKGPSTPFVCGATGEWGAGGSIDCEQITCGALPAGRAENTDGRCQDTAAGQTCTAVCKAGYTAKDPDPTFVCGATGEWKSQGKMMCVQDLGQCNDDVPGGSERSPWAVFPTGCTRVVGTNCVADCEVSPANMPSLPTQSSSRCGSLLCLVADSFHSWRCSVGQPITQKLYRPDGGTVNDHTYFCVDKDGEP
eukprot:COSAG05_NODE_5853_length_1073_cov_0.824435_1_plen_319_part_01